MYNVIICCDGVSSLYQYLGRMRHFFEGNIFSDAARERGLTVVEAGQISQISAQNPILILPKALKKQQLTPSSSVFTVIANSDFFAVQELQGYFPHAQIITCGLSGEDTCTFSSCGDGQAVVSLQSPITTVAGATVLPQDIPLQYTAGAGRFDLLACSALLLLCDCGGQTGELYL